MSVGAGIHESYWTDPLTLAAKARHRPRHHRRRGGRQPRQERRRRQAVRRHHGARQRAVGADGRRLEHEGHADAQRRHDRELQLARADAASTSWRSRTSSRPASARSRWPRRAARFYNDEGRRTLLVGQLLGIGYEAVPEPERHQHGGAGRHRHRRADAAGEPESDAEPRSRRSCSTPRRS